MSIRFIWISLWLLLVTLWGGSQANGQIHFPMGSSFRFLRGSDAVSIGLDWKDPGYDDSGWSTGSAPFRYGDGVGGTLLDDMQNTYTTVFFRSTFLAGSTGSLEPIDLWIDYDDGFVLWVNGEEVLRRNAPGVLNPDATATENHESGTAEVFEIDPRDLTLAEGENTLAVLGLNVSNTSSDFMMNLSLEAEVKKPVLIDSAGLSFSMPSGFYDSVFFLEIVPSEASWNVLYTLDGSNPQDSETAILAKGSAHLLIDPESTAGRAATSCVTLRASAAVEGILPAIPESRTYIFLEKVLTQGHPGGDWPTDSINGQVIDMEMDNRITTHAAYRDLMIPSLLEVPSISVITDPAHLFDPETGIYVNAYGHGPAWERSCAVELIDPDGSGGFRVNAGLRIRGGWSRHPEFAKHAFRLFFRSEYGDSKLHYPLFGKEGTGHYDKIDLRTAQNYAWSNGDGRNTFLRDVFSRDLQRDMGQPYTRSRFFHLYLNGMYWGLFQTQERSEARFASDYFGGKPEDYDVVKVDTENWNYQIEATDGNLDLWYQLYQMCNAGFTSNGDFFRILGRNAEGDPFRGGRVYVELDNLIDYMLSIFYTGNFDAPTSTFGWNKGPNNFYAIIDRSDPSRGFTFYNHDAEHCLFSDPADPGTGLFEDRVNLTQRTDGKHMEVNHFGSFHPQWLHHKLTANIEYRVRFMDRAFLHMEGEGALTAPRNLTRLVDRESEIDTAIVAESARWGDARPWVSSPHTRNDHWIPEVQKIKDHFFPYRTDILKEQLLNADLYSVLEAPGVYMDGEELRDRLVETDGSFSLRIENRSGTGAIVYTLDGSDPRQAGGFISPRASVSEDQSLELEFSSAAVLKARTYQPGTWSPLKEVSVFGGELNYDGLSLTELHYHPPDTLLAGDSVSGKDLEFIEFKNTGEEALPLAGLVLDSAVYFVFPPDRLLAPGAFFVVASKPSKFFARYGMIASGNFQKNLSNGGEEILLRDTGGNEVIRFIYSDDPPWPAAPDGSGHSLVTAEYLPGGDPGIPEYWRSSTEVGGSPFADDPFPVGAVPAVQIEREMLLYPNPTSGLLRMEFPAGGMEDHGEIRIFSLQGKLLYQEPVRQGTVTCGPDDRTLTRTLYLNELGIPPGFYLIRVRTAAGTFSGRVILQD